MKISDLFPSRYLRATDLGTKEHRVTIGVVRLEEMAGKRKPVVYFEGAKKGLVLNRTNALAIARLYGDDTDAWPGKKVVLYASLATVAGERVDCVRVREP